MGFHKGHCKGLYSSSQDQAAALQEVTAVRYTGLLQLAP